MRLLILSDTHLPRRAKVLPAEVWDAVDAADVVLHAGDWVDVETFRLLEQRSRRLVGVAGNNDGPELHALMPEVARVVIEGVRFAMVHDSGPSRAREARMAAAFPDADVLVFGHSHIPWDSTAPGGLRLLNPGSPTDRRRQPHHTYLTASIDGGSLADVRLHRLPPRASEAQSAT